MPRSAIRNVGPLVPGGPKKRGRAYEIAERKRFEASLMPTNSGTISFGVDVSSRRLAGNDARHQAS